jgi:hypothetical protein
MCKDKVWGNDNTKISNNNKMPLQKENMESRKLKEKQTK